MTGNFEKVRVPPGLKSIFAFETSFGVDFGVGFGVGFGPPLSQKAFRRWDFRAAGCTKTGRFLAEKWVKFEDFHRFWTGFGRLPELKIVLERDSAVRRGPNFWSKNGSNLKIFGSFERVSGGPLSEKSFWRGTRLCAGAGFLVEVLVEK